ncbi:MAG: DEAD/DEAH box helicase [Gemmatimonadetes bacterium]|nr:DEAD/DEAH box helicase [Gemmatimonadota bacterium]
MSASISPLLQLPNTYRAFYGSFPYLYPFQKQSIEPLLQGKDLILQSATGSGKTEAVLAPCIERIIQSGRQQTALYVVPTRALAVDLERRLTPVLKDKLGLQMGIRTGDFKRAGGALPDLLLTTPESFDVLMGSSNADVKHFVQRIRTVIIDEAHPLVYHYRGRQLSYLLTRLQRRIADPVQKIALSATLADVEEVGRFFGFRPDAVFLTEPVQRDIVPHLIHLKNDDIELVALLNDLYETYGYRKILLFANSRGCCDQLFSLLSRQGAFQGVTDLHYSNLNASTRRAVEYRFRRREHALCIATSTLELGIDIGDVDGVLLYEPPDSTSAFLQRIGRSNRREGRTHFWGICKGADAKAQLLRFLGMLNMAHRGHIETPQPKTLPSVLVQQMLSCLYEKKAITQSALCDLFPDQRDMIAQLFEAMARQQWLRKDRVTGLFKGGQRYGDCFLERRIWSNFPEAEEDYVLEFAGEAIADLPKFIVRQLELGDRVQLTGKRLRVLNIETDERKRVVAQPTDRLDEKELFWLGSGFRVSYEVAQSVRDVRHTDVQQSALGLFSRTRKLLNDAARSLKRAVVLHNGVEVERSLSGLYRYYTYLGSVGNLVLQWIIERDCGDVEDFVVTSDSISIDCSQWIDFQTLRLPQDREDFVHWVEEHLDSLYSLFPLNAFCEVLPRALLVQEVTDFLFDPRVAKTFQGYLKRPSEIASGDPELLAENVYVTESHPIFLDTKIQTAPLLAWEKQRWHADRFAEQPADPQYRPRSLTGTMVGAYFLHHQCERWLAFNFLPSEQTRWADSDTDLNVLRMERGKLHEKQVLNCIRDADVLREVPICDTSGRRLSLKARFETTLALLKDIDTTLEQSTFLFQAVLIQPSVLGQEDRWMRHVDGIGIPDLIRISKEDSGIVLQVGDIKDSRRPYETQKWQVAFYAHLLDSLIAQHELSMRVASSGFLMLRSSRQGKMPEPHFFDLEPYLTALPMMFRNMNSVLQRTPAHARYHLQSHCTTCPNFEACYREALHAEDIHLLPHLSAGALQKFCQHNLKTIASAHAWFESVSVSEGVLFSPHQKTQLSGQLAALQENKIGLKDEQTRSYPSNLSTTIFIHIVEDPVSGHPRAIGWRAMQGATAVESQIIEVASEGEASEALRDFTARFLSVWRRGIKGGRGPHVFYFGSRCWQTFEDWCAASEDLSFLFLPHRNHRTDLQKLIASQFDFPMPGNPTLFALNRLLGFNAELTEPQSLFHFDDGIPYEDPQKMADYFDAVLRLQISLWQWASSHLTSVWKQGEWDSAMDEMHSPQIAYLNFLAEERRLREEDVLALQALPLSERVERFRALGPIRFQKTALDDEGRFLYEFQAETGLSKFRSGDFLKLAPVGLSDVQNGLSVILTDHNADRLWVQSRQGRLALSPRLMYSLEEDLTDWNSPRLIHGVQTVFSEDRKHLLSRLFSGNWQAMQDPEAWRWVQNWMREFGAIAGLNATQEQALSLPFKHRLSLIEGPPGTGKTHLLGWIVIALIMQAYEESRPLRIAISALTHQAIDQVLNKVVSLVEQHDLQGFPGQCFKLGRSDLTACGIESLEDVETLSESPYAIIGATGFGLYQLFEGRKGDFPPVFDWVVFDEASQILIPQSLLSLLYGKGNFLFAGDTKQLPPIVFSDRKADEIGTHHSVLFYLLNQYDFSHCVRLDRTYRMNEDVCSFPSHMWYDGELRADACNAHNRLVLQHTDHRDLLDRILDPAKPVVLLIVDHFGNHQKSDEEVEVTTQLAYRLIAEHGLDADQIALISPHRAQNNATADRLAKRLGDTNAKLPLIDTVERVQGAERDVILYAFTTSDPDYIDSPFLNNPNRFNVAITRARQKLIVVGSQAFFSAIPQTEDALAANRCFKAFYEFCRERESLFFWA